MNCGKKVRLNPTKTISAANFAQPSGIHAAGDLRKPEMYAAQVGHDHAADHYVMEVRDDEVGVGQMDIDCHGRQEQAGKSADGEQPDEAERVQHGRFIGDRAFIHGGGPVENLDRRRHGHQKAEKGEYHARRTWICPATNR